MSTPGWYPDPGGRAGHYRLWDGQAWGLSTTTEPPGGPPTGPPPPPKRRRGTAWVVAGTVLALVLVVVGVLALGPGGPAVAPTPSTTSRPGANDGPTTAEPSTTPASASGSSTTRPSPTASPTPTTPCPIGNPFAQQDHPRDGRVHGGGLSFPRQRGWEVPGRQADTFTWAYDLGETDLQVEPQWYAAYAVGAVAVADGFEDPRTAAELALRCTLESALYRNVTSRTDLVNEKTTVDGYPAWTIRAEIRADDDRTTFEGDTVQVTVVDLDSPDALGFFWGSAPLGDQVFTDRLDEVATQLRVG